MTTGIIVLSLVMFLALLVPSAWLTVTRKRTLAGPPAVPGEPGLLEVAYLRGGPIRVVDTAITRMCEDGRVSVNSSGELKVERAAADNAVERALLARCGPDWGTKLYRLRVQLQFDQAVDGVRSSLVNRGLLISRAAEEKWKRAGEVQVGGLVVGGVIALGLLGVPAALPVAIVGLILLAGGVKLRMAYGPRPKAGLTPRGQEFTDRLGRTGPWSVRTSAEHPEGVAGVVAVRDTVGPEPDQPYLHQLRLAVRTRPVTSTTAKTSKSAKSSSSSSSSYSSYSSSSGGYSCSGASSCSSGSHHSGHSGHSSCSSGSSCSSSSSSCGGGSSCSS
ncbi:TIGR04222 domain-containing membrane protein [Streptomyces roseoverticillatus]|uniref:TIGR04222 domain-containing membrane protein n=1 Tax=Streptomyces roseoverticillatus TaxID=66429 RepID=UPI001F31E30E|nr:TIGR04222 domain-containing membrane protein [Streptomyces roseoverticillatus]MCF3101385.1 TIGR04222 domain-containing membrane protein [Streptomyces roseoverticillatus]